MYKDGGMTGSVQLGQVSFRSRAGGMKKEGLHQQLRRIYTLNRKHSEEGREGKGREGKARQGKARQGKARQGKARG